MPSKMAAIQSSTSLDSPPSDSGSASRHQRNLAEKQRRDKLNGYINELAAIVPIVAMTTKRLDKTSILRLSAAYLRIHQSCLNIQKYKKKITWRPDFLNSSHLDELLEAVEGFLLSATYTGKIIFVSNTVEHYLGHQNIEMIGHSLYSFIHPADVDRVREELKTLAIVSSNKNGQSQTRCTFCCRLRERSQPRSEVVTYQMMHFSCHLSFHDEKEKSYKTQMITSKGNKNVAGSVSNSLLNAFVLPVNTNPLNELSITEALEEEYITRHGVDGKILYADHRIATITGHLPDEVQGTSAYGYILDSDIPIASFAHKLMFSSSNGTGMIVYRLRTRNQSSVYLKSIGHLQYEKSTTQVDHFVCINKLLSEEEGEEELRKFIEQFTPRISTEHATALYRSFQGGDQPVSIPQLLDAPASPESSMPCLLPNSPTSSGVSSTIPPHTPTPHSCESSLDMPLSISSVKVEPVNGQMKCQAIEMDCMSPHMLNSITSQASPEVFEANLPDYTCQMANVPNSQTEHTTSSHNKPINEYPSALQNASLITSSEPNVLNITHSKIMNKQRVRYETFLNGRKRGADNLSTVQEYITETPINSKQVKFDDKVHDNQTNISLHKPINFQGNKTLRKNAANHNMCKSAEHSNILNSQGVECSLTRMYQPNTTRSKNIYEMEMPPDLEFAKETSVLSPFHSSESFSRKQFSPESCNLAANTSSNTCSTQNHFDNNMDWNSYNIQTSYPAVGDFNSTLPAIVNNHLSSPEGPENDVNLQILGMNCSPMWMQEKMQKGCTLSPSFNQRHSTSEPPRTMLSDFHPHNFPSADPTSFTDRRLQTD